MPRRLAHKSSVAEGGFVRTVYRYDDLTTRTVLRDPVTNETQLEATGTCRLDPDTGGPATCWWKPV